MAANKIKKAQTGNNLGKRKPVTERDLYKEYIPQNVERMRNVRPIPASDSVLNRRIKEGVVRKDERSGDVFPTKKYFEPGRSTYKKGGVVKKKTAKRK